MYPAISVIMSSYNGSRTIDRAIKSILNQTYSNFEFIICNDGSTDNTLIHINKFAKKDSRIRIINHSKNRGLQESLNDCLKISRGRLIARMDDDDYSYRNRFKYEVSFLNQHLNIAFVGTNEYITNNNIVYGRDILPEFPTSEQLFKRNCFSHPSIMIRSNILKNNHGYSTSKTCFKSEDYELWLRLYSKGYRGANLQKILFEYNVNLSNYKNNIYGYINAFKILFHYRNKFNLGIEKYFWISLPLIKCLIPKIVKNYIYKYEYRLKLRNYKNF